MFEHIQPADAPVVEGLEKHEIVYARNQPEYIPLRTLRSTDDRALVLSRWSLTPEQRLEIAAGADIYLELMTFRDIYGTPNPLTPIRMAIGKDVTPELLADEYGLPY